MNATNGDSPFTAQASVPPAMAEFHAAVAKHLDAERRVDVGTGVEAIEATVVWGDAIADFIEPPPLVNGLMGRGEIGTLVAAGGTGKTWLAILLALSVANGVPFAGRATVKVKALYVASEAPRVIRKRFARMAKVLGLSLDDVAVYPHSINLTSDAEMANVAAFANKYGFGLIVVDTYSRSLGGANENDQPTASTATEWMQAMANTAWMPTVLALHHPGHGDKDRGRGSSALYSNIDFELIATGNITSGVMVRDNKQRDGVTGALVAFKLDTSGEFPVPVAIMPTDVAEVEPVDVAVGEARESMKRLARKSRSVEGKSKERWVDSVKGHSKANLRTAFELLFEAGFLVPAEGEEEGKRGCRYVFNRELEATVFGAAEAS